jgi:hypothetical protein
MRRAALVASLLGLAACGGSDGGDGGARGAWTSFDVTAALTLTPPAGDEGSWATFPKTAKLTLAWNEKEGVSVTGADGAFGHGATTRAADGSFRTSGWAAGVPFTDGCGGTATIFLEDVTFSIVAGVLSGSGTGRARFITSGADTLEAPVTATLAGGPDMTPPVLSMRSAASSAGVDPLEGVSLSVSEPVSAAWVQLLNGAPLGDAHALVPEQLDQVDELAVAFRTAFSYPRYGQTYTLDSRLTDLSGNPVAPLTFTTQPEPPLVSEDGFESVTGTMFSGAGVLRGGPLTPISGQTSLLLNTGFGGGFGFLPYDLGPSFAGRLAVNAGDTVVRFSYQLIAPDSVDGAFFDGTVRVAWPGGSVFEAEDLDATQFTRTTLPTLGDIFLSPVKTVEVPLPAGQGSEIAFEIVGLTLACKRPPSPTVLVIDDLRVE